MLVLVLLAFVVVSLWFAYHVAQAQDELMQAREREIDLESAAQEATEKAVEGTRKQFEDRLAVQAPFVEVRAYTRLLEQAGLALDRGDLIEARDALERCEAEARGWEHDYLLGQTNRCLHELWRHRKAITCLAADRDGRRLVTGSEDGTVRVWDALLGQLLLTYREHHGPVQAVVLGPDGRQVVSGDREGNVHVWERETGRRLALVRPEKGAGNLLGLASPPTAGAWRSPAARAASSGARGGRK
jgi:hypothetical protein